jgi:hypothetical protein
VVDEVLGRVRAWKRDVSRIAASTAFLAELLISGIHGTAHGAPFD